MKNFGNLLQNVCEYDPKYFFRVAVDLPKVIYPDTAEPIFMKITTQQGCQIVYSRLSTYQ